MTVWPAWNRSKVEHVNPMMGVLPSLSSRTLLFKNTADLPVELLDDAPDHLLLVVVLVLQHPDVVDELRDAGVRHDLDRKPLDQVPEDPGLRSQARLPSHEVLLVGELKGLEDLA